MKMTFKPKGVCCTEIVVDILDESIESVKFTGGCESNLKAIGKLIKGMRIKDVITKLAGINCHGKGTSCTDQLCKFLKELL